MKAIFWYIGVVAAAALLVVGFITKGWVATICALVLGLVLKGTNGRVELPEVYQKLGVTNKAFEAGGRQSEKNH